MRAQGLTTVMIRKEYKMKEIDFVCWDHPLAKNVTLVGGKVVGLCKLSEIQEKDRQIKVSKWAAIPATWYKDFIQKNHLQGLLEELNQITEKWVWASLALEWTHSKLLPADLPDLEPLRRKSCEIRNAFLSNKLSERSKRVITDAYNHLCNQSGHKYLAVAVRSSATAEDLAKAAFAGRQDSYLNISGIDYVQQKVQECMASLFNDRAVEYRAQQIILLLRPELERLIKRGRNKKEATNYLLKNHGKYSFLRASEVGLAVILQEMVEAKAAGTVFTIDEGTGYEGVSVSANWGFGETVVGGLVTPDSWLFNKDSFRLLRQRRGPKTLRSVVTHGGVVLEKVPEEKIYEPVFNEEFARKLAGQACKISHYLNEHYIDLEYAIDQKEEIWWLQARPETYWSHGGLPILTVDDKTAKSARLIYEGGMTGAPGAAHGRIIVIPDLQEAQQKLKPGHLLITLLTHNQWSSLMIMVSGAGTETGNEGCHTAITMRELGRPALVGGRGLMQACVPFQGKVSTIDACRGQIFLGKLPLVPSKKIRFRGTTEDAHIIPPDHVFYDQLGRKCIAKPGYPLCSLQFDLYRICHEWAAQLFDEHCESVKVEGRHCIPIEAFKPVAKKIKRAPLWKIEQIADDWERIAKAYLDTSHQFIWEPTPVRKMFDLINKLNSYMSIGFNLYRITERRARNLLRRRTIPQVFRFEIRRSYFDKETETMRQIRSFGQIFEKVKESPQLFEGRTSKIISVLKKLKPDLYQQIVDHAMSYKVTKGTDLSQAFSIEPVIREIKRCLNSHTLIGPIEGEKPRTETIFFPDDERFNRTLKLAVKIQLLRDDSHHIKVRGQWYFHEKMMAFARRCVRKGWLINSQAIFDLTVEEVIALTDKLFTL